MTNEKLNQMIDYLSQTQIMNSNKSFILEAIYN